MPLPEAYRSLSRPSSAPDAKAFPLRSYQLDLVEQPFQAVLLIMNYAEIIQKFQLALLSFTLTKQLSPFNLVPQHCFHCPLLLALHT